MPRKARKFEHTRARLLAGYLSLNQEPPFLPKNRSFRSVRKAAMPVAEKWLPFQGYLILKDPDALLRDFRRRFDQSTALRALLRREELDREAIARTVNELIVHFDPPGIAPLRSPPKLEVIGPKEAPRVIGTLERAAQILERLEDETARSVSATARLLREIHKGPAPRKGSIGARREIGRLLWPLDLFLDRVPRPERFRLIAGLVTDFRRPYTEHNVRTALERLYGDQL